MLIVYDSSYIQRLSIESLEFLSNKGKKMNLVDRMQGFLEGESTLHESIRISTYVDVSGFDHSDPDSYLNEILRISKKKVWKFTSVEDFVKVANIINKHRASNRIWKNGLIYLENVDIGFKRLSGYSQDAKFYLKKCKVEGAVVSSIECVLDSCVLEYSKPVSGLRIGKELNYVLGFKGTFDVVLKSDSSYEPVGYDKGTDDVIVFWLPSKAAKTLKKGTIKVGKFGPDKIHVSGEKALIKPSRKGTSVYALAEESLF